jgi:hypothetical protein
VNAKAKAKTFRFWRTFLTKKQLISSLLAAHARGIWAGVYKGFRSELPTFVLSLDSKMQRVLVAAGLVTYASALTFTRLGACPSLGCVFPPDQASFLPGQYFDVRLEVHAPVSGSEAFNKGVPDSKFTFCIQQGNRACTDAAKFFKSTPSVVETYNFTYAPARPLLIRGLIIV